MTPSRTAKPLALAAVLVVLLAGCSVFTSDDASKPKASATPSSTAADPSPSAETTLAGYYRQKLAWKSCRKDFQCATLRVPLDYAKPGGRAIGVEVLKVPAKDQADRLGSMVVDPGGPGGSGMDYAAAASTVFGDKLRARYDVVGLDPRGVGKSTPLDCGSDALINRFLETDPDPDTAAERKDADAGLRNVGEGCLADSGELARHMSTIEVAKDLDVLRQALGDRKLTYFGASYGTFIGATYAELFPKKVGRLVLDGALDPASSTLEVNLVQAKGFETALRAYVAACVSDGDCPLGSSVDEGTRRVRTFLRDVEAEPLKTSSDELTVGEAIYGVWYPLYDKAAWSVLDTAFEQAFDGDGSLMLRIADAYLHRSAEGTYLDNSMESYYAVSCLDRDDGPSSAQTDSLLPRFEKISPTFGSYFAYASSSCTTWPIHSGRKPAPVDPQGIPPVLVVGTTRDPATPLVWARALTKQLGNGAVLVTRDGDGHTGYRQGSDCVDDTIESYLVDGTVPKADVTC